MNINFDKTKTTAWEMFGLTSERVNEIAEESFKTFQKIHNDPNITHKDILEDAMKFAETPEELAYSVMGVMEARPIIKKAIETRELISSINN